MATGTHTRRGIIKALAAGTAIGALGACTVTHNGNVTTITLDVAKVKAYATAGINAVSTVLSIGAVATAIGAPAIAIIESASAALESSLAGFASAAGSSVSVSYDTTSIKSAVNSVLMDLETVSDSLQGALVGAKDSIAPTEYANTTTALSALKTVVSVFEGVLGVVSLHEPTMTEDQALRKLRVTV